MQENKLTRQLLSISVMALMASNNLYASELSDELAKHHMHHNHADHAHYQHTQHDKGMWMFDVMSMYMNMDGFQSGASSAPAPSDDMMVPTKMDMYITMFMAMYMTKDWDVMLMGSYNYKFMDMDMNMHGKTERSSMKSQGFGDTEISGGYNIVNNRQHKLQVRAGVSLPTGRINYDGAMPMMDVEAYGYNMQMGSGTFDPVRADRVGALH